MDLPANVILDLKSVHPDDAMHVGVRAARLALAHDLGYAIPQGFIVTTDLFEQYLDETDLDGEIETLMLARSDRDADWEQTAEAIGKRIRDTKIPDAIAQEIMKRYVSMGGFMDMAEVVIRPSLTSAWQPARPHLGHLDSYYHIKGESNVVWMVRECWAAFFSAKLLQLRERHHIHEHHLGMAVLVEESVRARWSGVATTLNPVDDNNRVVVVEAVEGLWEISQHEAVEPDHYQLLKDEWTLLEKRKGHQAHVITYKNGKPVVLDVAPKTEHHLTQEIAVDIGKVARQLEHRMRCPVEIDWAIVNKTLVVLGIKELESQVIKVSNTGSIRLKKVMQAEPGHRGLVSGPVAEFLDLQAPGVIHPGAIVVTRTVSPVLLPVLRHAGGLIVEEGGQTSYGVMVARELAIPCVVGAHGILDRVDNRMPVTIDGEQGIIYQGALRTSRGHTALIEAVEPAEERAPITVATPMMVIGSELTDWHDVIDDAVGVHLFPDGVIKKNGIHPEWLSDRHKLDVLGKQIAELVTLSARKASDKEVLFNLSDLSSFDYKQLERGEQYESDEVNPVFGFHGAQRLLANYEQLDVELEALKVARHKARLSNVSVVLRGVRHPRQVMALKKHLSGHGLMRGGNFRIYVAIETPHMVEQMKELQEIGVDGVTFDLPSIARLYISYEPVPWDDSTSVDACMNCIREGLEEAKKYRLKRRVRAMEEVPEFVWYELLRGGVQAVETDVRSWEANREAIAAAEGRLVSRK